MTRCLRFASPVRASCSAACSFSSEMDAVLYTRNSGSRSSGIRPQEALVTTTTTGESATTANVVIA